MCKAEMKNLSRKEIIRRAEVHVRRAANELGTDHLTRREYKEFYQDHDVFSYDKILYYAGCSWGDFFDRFDDLESGKKVHG